MAIQLFKHNQEAYDKVIAMLTETGKAAVIHPTGTGKSFIGFKLSEDNPKATVCWCSPSEYIYKTQCENIGQKFDNIKFFTYAKLAFMTEDEVENIKADYIILDEFHRCGAEVWGKGVKALLETYPDAPILGLTATNIRYLDNQRDMADELFDSNVASEMTLGEAIVRGILNPPKYILSVYAYQKELEKYQKRVKRMNKATRDQAEKVLEDLKRALDMADGLDRIFEKHITDKTGKYIVFCANVEHLTEMKKKTSEWFCKVDQQPHVYTAIAEDTKTAKAIADFKSDQSAHLKLLYCIDMLNEGIHVDDVDGVILLRPTVSPIIYKQQIGRALSANRKKNPIIFDIVMNIDNLNSISALEEDIQVIMTYYRERGLDHHIVNDRFTIIDETQNCIEIFNRLNDQLTMSWDAMANLSKRYFEENGNLDVPKRYVTEEGYSLGSWLETQRKVYRGKIPGDLTEEKIARLEAIGMQWESSSDRSWEKYFQALLEYKAKNGDVLVPVRCQFNGINLGNWVFNLRNIRKNKIKCNYLTPERIEKLDAIGMIWDIPDYLFEQNYNALLQYHQTYGDINVPVDHVTAEGIKLGLWLSNLRAAYRKDPQKIGGMTAQQKAKLEAIGIQWGNKKTAQWEQKYQAAADYYKAKGDLNIPVAYQTADGIRLGKWISHQRYYHQRLSAGQIQRLNRIGMRW